MNDYAILVGINTYPQQTQLDPLEGPHNDLERIKAWLTTARGQGGGGLQEDNILRLSDSTADAAYSNVINAVLIIRERIKQSTNNINRPIAGRLYLYFAGHGVHPPMVSFSDEFETGFLPIDWRPQIPGQFIPIYELTLYMMATGDFEEIITICDACRTKEHKDFSPQSLPFAYDPAPNNFRSRVIICHAAKTNEFAVEREYDGVMLGAFSKAFSEALLAAPRDENGDLTFTEFKKFVRDRLPSLIGPHDFQHPVVEARYDGEEIVMASGGRPNLEMRFTFKNAGTAEDLILYDAEFRVIHRFPAGHSAPVKLHAEAGEYLLQGATTEPVEILNYELKGKDVVIG